MAENEKKKKYTIVDKRGSFDDEPEKKPGTEEPATGDIPGDDEPKTTRQTDTGDRQKESDTSSEEAPRKEIRINDAMRFAMNLLRERALLSLGLVISKDRPKEPDMEQVKKISELFGKLADSFCDELGRDDYSETSDRIPPFEETLGLCFNMLQSQIFMHIGLVANPVTGLISKDMAQAKSGIDFFAALLDNSREILPQKETRKLDAALSDLRVNYVNQS